MYTVAVGSSLRFSITNHEYKVKVIRAFSEFDVSMSKLDYKKFNKNCAKRFVILLLLSIITTSLFLISCWSPVITDKLYALHITILSHIIHVEAFQIYIFAKGIQIRLEIVSNKFEVSCEPEDSEVEKCLSLKESLIKLYEVNQQFKDCFKIPLLFNLMELYAAILINMFWLCMALLGISFAHVSGKYIQILNFSQSNYDNLAICSVALLLIIPSALILLYLAKIDNQTQKLFRKIISSSTSLTTCLSENEGLLILLHRCKFISGSLRAFDTRFATFGKVSLAE